jgi:CHASE2 domain-containing sensor protein
MGKVSIKGVLIGSIVDIVASVALGLPFSLYAMSKVDLSNTPKAQIESVVSTALRGNTLLHVVELLIGMACSVFAGYLAARLAKHDELLNGALSSFLCVGGGVWIAIAGKDSQPMWVQILLIIASPALGLLGGHLQFKMKRPTVYLG